MKRVLVIGGGISGLACAHRLLEERDAHGLALEVALLEAGDRPGGSIHTETRDGFVIEQGADSFITTKPAALDLCNRLGLEDELIRTNDAHRKTLILSRGQLHPLPDGLMMLAPTQLWPFVTSPLFSWSGKVRMGLDLVLPPCQSAEDESLASFVRRRLGQEALDRLAQPMIGGIYTADPETLSLRATMPQLLELEAQHGSVIRGLLAQRNAGAAGAAGARYSLFVSLRRGMQTLVEALAARLGEVVRRQQRVRSVTRASDQWQVQMEDGAAQTADAVVLATPAFVAAGLLRDYDMDLSAELAAIEYASSVVVNLAYCRDEVPHPLDGFGFVVPAVEQRSIIAGSFSSVKFTGRAPEGKVLLRCFAGGALQPAMCDLDDEQLLAACGQELRDLLGIQAAPLFATIHRHPRAMPQYKVGHLDRVARIRARAAATPGLQLAGNAFDGVGIPDCVRAGEGAAVATLANLFNGSCQTGVSPQV